MKRIISKIIRSLRISDHHTRPRADRLSAHAVRIHSSFVGW